MELFILLSGVVLGYFYGFAAFVLITNWARKQNGLEPRDFPDIHR